MISKALVAVPVAFVFVVLAAGASPAGAQTAFEPPRLPDGRPDLQGVWDFRTLTPLERPADLADKAVLTDEEASELESQAAARDAAANAPTERGDEILPVGGDVGAYNAFWVDQGAGVVEGQRTSLIVDPPDGRLPALQRGVEMQQLSLAEDLGGTLPVRVRAAGIGTDSHEDRGLAERCLLGFNTGPPIVPVGYNQNIQIFQTADHVVIFHEMVHDARIVPLDGREHLPASVRQWMGDSRGYWDGDTLVIESTNFTAQDRELQPVDRAGGGGRHPPAPDGAFQPGGARHAALRVHRERPDDLHAAVHRPAADAGAATWCSSTPATRATTAPPTNMLAGARAPRRRRRTRSSSSSSGQCGPAGPCKRLPAR